jgi:hypothetical protein
MKKMKKTLGNPFAILAKGDQGMRKMSSLSSLLLSQVCSKNKIIKHNHPRRFGYIKGWWNTFCIKTIKNDNR